MAMGCSLPPFSSSSPCRASQVNPPFMIHSVAVEDHLLKILDAATPHSNGGQGGGFALSFVLVYPSAHFWDKHVTSHAVYKK